MPSLVKIRVERGRDLPVMDSHEDTDAFVEIKLDDQSQKTSTCKRSLNPVWNEEIRFEVLDDSVLQDAPIELKCMDQDLYSS
jgi:Ca2+-dependent lipid-binding protein